MAAAVDRDPSAAEQAAPQGAADSDGPWVAQGKEAQGKVDRVIAAVDQEDDSAVDTPQEAPRSPGSARRSTSVPVLAAAGGGAVLSLVLCAGFALRLRRRPKRPHKYVQHKDDESGMPPEIVGATAGDRSPGDETFVIDDVEMWGEEETFEFAGDKFAQHFSLAPNGFQTMESDVPQGQPGDSPADAHLFTPGAGADDSVAETRSPNADLSSKALD